MRGLMLLAALAVGCGGADEPAASDEGGGESIQLDSDPENPFADSADLAWGNGVDSAEPAPAEAVERVERIEPEEAPPTASAADVEAILGASCQAPGDGAYDLVYERVSGTCPNRPAERASLTRAQVWPWASTGASCISVPAWHESECVLRLRVLCEDGRTRLFSIAEVRPEGDLFVGTAHFEWDGSRGEICRGDYRVRAIP